VTLVGRRGIILASFFGQINDYLKSFRCRMDDTTYRRLATFIGCRGYLLQHFFRFILVRFTFDNSFFHCRNRRYYSNKGGYVPRVLVAFCIINAAEKTIQHQEGCLLSLGVTNFYSAWLVPSSTVLFRCQKDDNTSRRVARREDTFICCRGFLLQRLCFVTNHHG
jgi:hypothetical protein